MADNDDVFRIYLNGTFSERDGYWVAKVPALGRFAYGDTPEEAQLRAQRAATVLMAHWNEHDVLTERLNSAGIEFDVESEPPVQHEWAGSVLVPTGG